MTYLFLVGLAHALAYRRESERRALDCAQLETRLVEAQLQSLQRQLHPHFLFNTLNTISGLMRTDVDAADRMMDRLGDLLRMTLSTSNVQEVPLKEELEVLQKYLDIEQIALRPASDRVACTSQPDDARRAGAELSAAAARRKRGAARHRAARAPGQDRDRGAAREATRLAIRIRDSGDGVPPHYLTLLNQGVGLTTPARGSSICTAPTTRSSSRTTTGFCVTVSHSVRRPSARLAEPMKAGAA